MTITNKALQEILLQYPDESIIYMYNTNYIDSRKDIETININYDAVDSYKVPEIIFK